MDTVQLTPKRSIRTRILAVFSLSLILFGSALVYGIVQLRAIGETLMVVDVGYIPLAGVVADLSAVTRQMDRDYDRFAQPSPGPVEGHRANARFYQASLDDGLTRADAVIATASPLVTDIAERTALIEADSQLQALRHLAGEHWASYEQWAKATPDEATPKRVEMDRKRKELGNGVRELAGLVQGRIQLVSEQSVRAQRRALVVSGALASIAFIMAGVLAWVALVTLRPIDDLTQQVQRLTRGDYTGRVDIEGDDEVGVLGREFNAMADAVSERDRRLHERAEALDRLSLRLRQVLDTIQAGLVVAEGGQIRTANPAAQRLWALSEGDRLPGGMEALDIGRHEGVRLQDRLYDIVVVPFGEGSLFVGDDVTDRLRDRERLQRSERLALVGQMMAQITHEVRNPLNAISLNAELLGEEIQTDDGMAMLGTVTSEIRRLETLTGRYLDLSRRRQPQLAAEDPAHVIGEVARLEGEPFRRFGVELDCQVEPMGIGEIDGDALRRVLRNVLLNAQEAGAKSVAVEASRTDQSISVLVTDDGPGMDAEQVTRVFEPFYTTKAKGTGLGLAISRQELEDVGGRLTCTSIPGQGTTFEIYVPVAWS